MPIVALIGIFNGSVNIGTDRLHEMIAEQQSVAIEAGPTWKPPRRTQATTPSVFRRHKRYSPSPCTTTPPNLTSQASWWDASPEQTDEELIAAVSSLRHGIVAADVTNAMAVPARHISTAPANRPTTKNSTDLVMWAEFAYAKGWGYVEEPTVTCWMTASSSTKQLSIPMRWAVRQNFIEANWLAAGPPTVSVSSKGLRVVKPTTNNIIYAANGMPDIGADDMYNNATERND